MGVCFKSASRGLLASKQAAPLLPPLIMSGKVGTLVLDLDETLVHYVDNFNTGMILVRPGCHEFLMRLSQVFEIVIFTAGIKEYADWVIGLIDREGEFIERALYRDNTFFF